MSTTLTMLAKIIKKGSERTPGTLGNTGTLGIPEPSTPV
jgi:hypothetical protein